MDSYVKVLRSYDYNHFEFCIPVAENATVQKRNEARKDCERLANEAVRQYLKSKNMALERGATESNKQFFLQSISVIENKPIGERTVDELAKLKQYEDETWESQFEYPYDYEDDEI